jgi:TRAP-type C4-dicarboxylate transport system substrate-binding protein
MATLAPKGTSVHQALLAMGEKWRQAPGGGAALTVYTDGSMGDEPDMVRRMRVGQLSAGTLTVQGLSDIDESVTALQNIPMLFQSFDEIDYVRGKLTPIVEKRFLEKGFVVLAWADLGWVHFFSKDPMVHPGDLKKMKLFVWTGEDNNYIDMLKSSGYQPVPLSGNDILLGLQTSLIETVPTVPMVALTAQFFGPAHHMLDIKWAPLTGGVVVARSAWDTIPSATQQALRASAVEAAEKIKQTSRVEDDQAVEAMKKRGLTVHSMTPEVEAEWRKAVTDLYPKIRGKMIPADMFDQAQHFVQEFRASGGKAKP